MVWATKDNKAGFASASSSNLSYLTEPPSLGSISDPNIVVAFKNILKSHTNTKTKGLDDLASYVRDHAPPGSSVEDAVVDAWVCYPPGQHRSRKQTI